MITSGMARGVDGAPAVRYREWLPFLGMADASYWNTELQDEDAPAGGASLDDDDRDEG